MGELPTDAWALVALALALGAKHGLDPDHLVAIDGLTRHNLTARTCLARWCGVLFSLGHGLVVLGFIVIVGATLHRAAVPGWLEDVGAWVSILFLAALGLMNLFAVATTPAASVVQTIGLKSRVLGRAMRASRPWSIMLVGALFAISFDTLSQAAIFALAATQVSGWGLAAAPGAAFLAGMMAADGLNGLWVAALLARADRRARIASRVMGLAVGVLSLAVAAYGAARYFSPTLANAYEGRELSMGLAVLGAIAMAFVIAMMLAPAAPEAPALPEAEK